MTGAPTKLAVLNTDSAWCHHPWPEVHARAENVAERIANDGAKAVGLVGDPTVEFIAAIPGTFFAGAAVSILGVPCLVQLKIARDAPRLLGLAI